MIEIKQWGIYICVTLIITLIFSMLIPNKELNSPIKFIIGIFMITSLAIPVYPQTSKIDISANTQIQTDYREKIQTSLNNRIEQNITELIQNELQKNGLIINNIKIIINNSDNTCISINKLIIYINQEIKSKGDDIKKIVNNLVAFVPEIIIE